MGSVYLAEQTGPGGFRRECALKLIHREAAKDAQSRKLLLTEAQHTAQINHANVVTVYEVGEHQGALFIALERIRGIHLGALVRRASNRRLPPAILAALIAQACDGLHAAHELRDADKKPMQLIHRDVSRSNLMCDTTGRVRVIDFGIVQARGRGVVTDPSMIRGNPAYMAPEQLEGRELDRRVDIYAAALVLYELCTGKHPFKDGCVRTELPPLHEVCPGIDASLSKVVAAALSLEAWRRPATIAILGEALWSFARANGCSGPGDLATFFAREQISLEPSPVRPLPTPTPTVPAPVAAKVNPLGARDGRIDLDAVQQHKLTFPHGELVLHVTTIDEKDHGLHRLFAAIEELPMRLFAAYTGGTLTLRSDDTRTSRLYLDVQRLDTRIEHVLLDESSHTGSFEVGHRSSLHQRVDHVVARPEQDRQIVRLQDPPVTLLAPLKAKMMFVLAARVAKSRTIYVECICICKL